MAQLALVYLPPSKLYKTKGASFVHSADNKATVIKLDTAPKKRRSQVAILKLAMESCGAPTKVYQSLNFIRTGPRTVKLTLSSSIIPKGNQALWLHSPALLRAYLAFLHLAGGVPDPTRINRNDIAHFLWVLREKDGKVPWHWPGLTLNGSTPKPAASGGLTPVFDGAKIVMYGETRIW